MDDSRRDGGQARGVQIASLDRVPVSAAYLAVVKRLLEAHGAALVEINDVLPAEIEGDARMYHTQLRSSLQEMKMKGRRNRHMEDGNLVSGAVSRRDYADQRAGDAPLSAI